MHKYNVQAAQQMTSYIETYHPKMTRWVEPDETVTVTEITQRTDEGVTATYRRDTTFSGNLSEAIKVLEFSRF